ncbi:SusC/RagA family TonB-linked outer membrane protein [Pedobacter sp. MC2016-14]|uniref:SusC/RagA family TonB-linked outer membrane protein n=1 Tax=Pedobacter sp. MC2016-14 TaxID=2897327 RepID=UPI001E5D5DA6|nr:SusC/RagA family TonB-linked outer membrane protein [Pedobacter sp. MC2016-14]MCD0488186.1 SusC/RagA family TonB-linked outer membrane protein [Pedobacter sp. MC2016-14]
MYKKFTKLLVIKLPVALLVFSFLQLNIAFAQKITFKKSQVSLEEVFKAIRKQSGYNIFYNAEMLKGTGTVSVNLTGASLQDAMRITLEGKQLDFKIVEKNIIISKRITAPVKQELTIRGKILNDQNNAFEGVSVRVKNSTVGTLTDKTGNYKIVVPNGNAVLTFSYLGFLSQERKVGANSVINLKLELEDTKLNEVVVTALGIKREEKALGYSITTLKGDDLTNAISNNWTDALSGKVAGLNLLRSNGGPAGSNRIILRGENSLSGTTEALIVLDGVVISNSSGASTGNGTAYMGDDSPTDYGSSINDINPADIESVSVLKGPGATALYGARGAGGAIIITTKLADPKVKGIGASFSSNTSFESVSRWPKYQNEYGQGLSGQDYYSYGNSADGTSTRSTSAAFGPKFDGQEYFQYDPNTFTTGANRTPWIAYPDNKKDFFETGATFTNSLSLEGGTKATSARLGYTNVQNSWIIPNTGYERNSVALSLTQKVTPKLQLSAKATYTNKSSDNLPAMGYNNQTIMYWMIRQVPNADLSWFNPYWLPGQEGLVQNRPFVSVVDNPYLITNVMLNKSNRNSVTGNVQALYNFTSNLSLMLRTSLDMSYDARSQQRPKDTQNYKQGMYRTQNIYTQEINADFLLNYKKDFAEKFTTNFSFGGSTLKNTYNKDEIRAETLFAPNIFNFANSMDVPIAYVTKNRFGVSSLYGLASIGYDNFIYLDLTGREDWTSTLVRPDGKVEGFFYHSENLSVVLSDKLTLPSYFSLLKLRASYAEVGSGGTTPYLTSFVYDSESNFPSGLSNPSVIANPNLRPERSKSIELGADIRFFNGRLGADVAVYQNNTKDQILRVPIDRASGYSFSVLNSGEVQNKGIEVSMNGAPIKHNKRGFNWNITTTFTANRNKILSLADSVETLILQTGPGSRGTIEARVGGSMGDMYGLGYQRSPDGQIVYANGYPVKIQTSRLLTNVYPKWKASIGNQFSYRQFRFNVLFDAQFGAKAYSHTHSLNATLGKLESTIPGRYNGIIGDGVILNADGSYRKNDVAATDISTYYTEHFTIDNVEANLFKTDYIKLREARLDYAFLPRLTKKLKLQAASIGIYGRDLFIISNWPSFDPEFGTVNNGLIQAGFEVGQFPATRTIGVNLNVRF